MITTVAIDGDTMVVCDSSIAFVYGLDPLQNVDAIECEERPWRIRRLGGTYYLVEEKRAGRARVQENK